MPTPPFSAQNVAKPAESTDNFTAIIWILFSVVTSSAMTIAVRDISTQLSSTMIVFLRASVSTALIVVAILIFAKLRRHLKFSRPWLHIIRGTLIAFSTQLGFYSISNLPLSTVTVLFFLAPIWATLLAIPIHGEKVGPRRIAAIALGFIGAIVILRPGFGVLHPAMLTAIGSSVLFALALSMSRGLARADGALSTYFSSVVITAIVMLPFAVPVFDTPHDMRAWVAGGVIVVAGAARGYADIEAYRLGEAGILAPITYLRLVFIAAAAYFLYAEIPDTPTIIGAVIIIGSTLYIAQRETKLRHRKLTSK